MMRARVLRAPALALGIATAFHCANGYGEDRLRLSLSRQLASVPGEHVLACDGVDCGGTAQNREPGTPTSASTSARGFTQAEIARTVGEPEHWSRLRVRTELGTSGRFNDNVRWKLSGRVDYDGVFDATNFYPSAVRNDERLNFFARENYIDFAAANWDFRLGRQHIIWGEIVGLFFADVVSAKDYRDFLLPEFDILRIPQWAAHAAYTGEQFHVELVWIPVPSYDKLPKPGAEFFALPVPSPPGVVTQVAGETRPGRKLTSTYGARVSTLQAGWDIAAFYYHSMDASPTFYRQVLTTPQPTVVYEPRHDRIEQFGATLGKDLGSAVLRAEAIYTRGRQYNVVRLTEADGVVPQNTFDWIGGIDFEALSNTRVNVQLFQRIFFDHDPDILAKRRETGYTLQLTYDPSTRTQAQVLFISSLDRSDWMLRPRMIWKLEKNWRLISGVDVFHGPPFGFFGRFANRDRVYAELRYSF